MKKFYAVGKNVFVKEIEQENIVGGFVIPDSVNVDFTIGEVISVDTGYYENGMYVTNLFGVGNVIAFPKVAGTKVTLNGEKLIRVMVNDIVAVEREGE
jgi:co-chaperonin GroES (HSP10)